MGTSKHVAAPIPYFFYCSATHVTSQVLQPKTESKRYRGRHTVISVHRKVLNLFIEVKELKGDSNTRSLVYLTGAMTNDLNHSTRTTVFRLAVSISKSLQSVNLGVYQKNGKSNS